MDEIKDTTKETEEENIQVQDVEDDTEVEDEEGEDDQEDGSEEDTGDDDDQAGASGDEDGEEENAIESESDEGGNHSSNESDNESSDNSERDKCCICLHKLKNQEIGVPTVCEHRFCCECITEWHKNSQTCPIDRQTFNSISVLRDDGTFIRMEELRDPNDAYLELPPLPDDITQCEVCGLGDREDRLLLCDECNFGYHLECLTPPLQTVPLDDWFCPSCTSDQIAHPRRRILVPPHIILPPAEPQSIQLSLLTRRIRQRRQKSRRKTVRRKTTKRKRKSTTKSKSITKTKAKTTKRKVGTRRRKGRKVRRKGKRMVRVVVQEKPVTSRDRLASQLGIVPPKPGQIYLGLPTCKSASQPSTSAAASMNTLNHQRFRAGISTLRLYSHYEDLADCLENESDDEYSTEEGSSVGLIRPARHRTNRLSSKMEIGDPHAGPMNQSSSVDILSQIMNSQQTLLMDRNIRIGRDGVLIPSGDSTIRSNEANHSINPSIPSRTPTKAVAAVEFPNGKIRQAPLNASESSSTSTQHSRYNNENSSCTDRREESNSRVENDTVNNTFPNLHGNENNDEINESANFVSDDGCGHSPQKSNQSKTKNDEKTKQSKDDDDEDFNIYSDIQENNVTDAVDPIATLPIQAELCVGDGQNESDDEMIIDEAANNHRASTDEKPTKEESGNKINPSDYVAFPPISDSDDSPSPGMPEAADSPESIPLPDSTPPPSVPMPEGTEDEEEEVDQIQGGSVLYSPSDDEETGRQVYDPSQPLTSSDEEEHSDQQKQQSSNSKPAAASKDTVNRNAPAAAARNVNMSRDVSSIPVPADEHKRPAIQFSIPTRHKLIPISSLIKRQRGVVRKESTGIPNSQLDTLKLFGESAQRDATDGASTSLLSSDKPSLVAEIFGSDDEEENKETTAEENVTQETSATNEVVEKSAASGNEPLVQQDCMQSNKWKRVDETPVPVVEPQATVSTGISQPLPPQIESAVTSEAVPEVETSEEGRTTQAESGEPSKEPVSVLELVSDGSDDDVKIISTTKREPDVIFLSSEKSSSNSKDSSAKEGNRDKKKDLEKRSRKDKDERHSRSQKRKLSSSLSNVEEGEIPSLDKKKKKVKKTKKLKKRKRSKDSNSSPDRNSAGKQNEIDQNFNSSSDDEDGRKVSWRKPSKSTKERNYRDGKPKTEEKYFREKDKPESSSLHDRKDVREKSPHHKSKDWRGSKSEGKKTSHRRSTSREKVSPIRWSRSPSPPRSRINRRERNRSRSLSSETSFSPRRSAHSRTRHLGHPLSIRNERSSSRSPRLRSMSPTSDRYRHRRRSRSKNRSRSNHRRSGRGGSGSRSRSRSKTRKRHDKDVPDKTKKGSSKKDKDKVNKESLDNLTPEEEIKDKEKKKKRKRREKSISPAKAVFADGDSIVISLNFQKPKDTPKESTEENKETTNNDESTEKKKKRNSGRDASSSGKSKPLKKTVLIDLETSPIQEQKIGESPTLVVLSDEENEEGNKSKSSRKAKDLYQNDDDHEGVTTSGGGEDSMSPSFQIGKMVHADSTQIHQTEMPKLKDFMFGQNDGTNSPARGDSIVTSTRDSIEGTIQTEEDSGSRSNSPKPLDPQSIRNESPRAKTPPVAASPLNRQVEGLRNDNLRNTPTSTASLVSTSHTNPSTPPTSSNNSSQGLVRPLGIGNIPGLFPSSGLVSGIPVPPSPVVIPTPPQPQLRFPANAMNPSINILASVANALYGPLMAARQAQPNILSKPMPTTNNINQRNSNQTNSSLTKSQNPHLQNRRTGDGGDSPFSPNSSDGDDLFEPPLEKRLPQKDSQAGTSGNSIGHKPEKTDRPSAPNPPLIGSGASSLNAKSKNALFDTLFGSSPSKKTPTSSSSAHHSKVHVKVKSKSHDSSKTKGGSKPDPKQLSEGELKQTEDVPTSAVELRVKEKYLKKLNRQERVVEEVKLALKPHYGKKIINKDDYKEILRRAVPKICHTKSGEINPFKIKELVEAYVKKFRHSKGK